MKQNKPLKILALSSEESTSGYYRVDLPALVLEKSGLAEWRITNRFKHQFQDNLEAAARYLLESVGWCDIVLVQRAVTRANDQLIDIAHELGKTVILDTDDLLDELPRHSGAKHREESAAIWEELNPRWAKVDAFTTTTPLMSDHYSRMFDRPAYTVPNAIDWDFPRWQFKRSPSFNVIAGWNGGKTHEADLNIIRPMIDNLCPEDGEKPGKITFEIQGGDIPEDWKVRRGLILSRGLMDIDRNPYRMGVFDIGMIPLVDEPFNSVGKSDLKALEYIAAGVVPIASNVGQYRCTVINMQTGILVENTTEAWTEAVLMLAKDEKLRLKMLDRARKHVFEQRSIQRCFINWDNAYREILKHGHQR